MHVHYTMRYFVLILLAAVALTSCNWINPSEETPSFIRVESIDFSTSSTQGTDSQNFVDAWIYIDGKSVGAYELPCTLPVLAEGEHTLRLFLALYSMEFQIHGPFILL